MAKEKKGVSTGAKLVTLGAAAAAAYWLYGSKEAAKHRKEARGWMLKARADVQKAVKTAKKSGALNKATYTKLVDSALSKYSELKDVVPAEMSQMSREIKAAFAHVQPEQQRVVKSVTKYLNRRKASCSG